MNAHVEEILSMLDDAYGVRPDITLDYCEPYQLLIATIMSAQCTDDRVNIVTKTLFQKYKSLHDFSSADLSELEDDIHSVGFYHHKAKNIIKCCKQLECDFAGVMPSDIDELTSLAGVGRKTANVIRTHVFNIPSITVDTHVKRISNLLGLTEEKDPVKIEFDLMQKLPKDHWSSINIQMIRHGRAICIARRPKCKECFLSHLCPSSLG